MCKNLNIWLNYEVNSALTITYFAQVMIICLNIKIEDVLLVFNFRGRNKKTFIFLHSFPFIFCLVFSIFAPHFQKEVKACLRI